MAELSKQIKLSAKMVPYFKPSISLKLFRVVNPLTKLLAVILHNDIEFMNSEAAGSSVLSDLVNYLEGRRRINILHGDGIVQGLDSDPSLKVFKIRQNSARPYIYKSGARGIC